MRQRFACLSSVLLGAVLAVSACGEAVSADPATQAAPATPTAQSWTIIADASKLAFSALQEGERFAGEFREFYGDIYFDPEDLPGSGVAITIPLISVSAGSKDRDSTLPGKVWFSTKAFPNARFVSNEIVTMDDGYVAKGQLTLKGISEDVSLPFTVEIDGDKAVMRGTMQLDRTRWNVGAAPWDTDEWVSRNVDLDIQVTATRE
jgi:polyisoprenoid-binding protein YceI